MAEKSYAVPSNRRRTLGELAFKGAAYLALLVVLAPALWLIFGVVARAVPHFQWNVLWTDTQGTNGGLENAILGTLTLMVGVFIVAGSVGVLAGIHLAELSNQTGGGRLHRILQRILPSSLLRLAVEVLSGFPSIVLGYVAYVALVVGLGWHFGLLPAVLTLSVLVVPYIAKSTETSLRQVPTAFREGAAALGISTGRTLRTITLRAALPGIATGLLLALAISGGETAPLLLTAGFTNQNPSLSLIHQPVAYLTYPVFNFYNSPSTHGVQLSYDAALLLIVMVLVLLVTARLVVTRTQRHAEAGASSGRRRRPKPTVDMTSLPTV
jgi:phosphate transport system permease protein